MGRAVAAEERLAVEYDDVKGVLVMAKAIATPVDSTEAEVEDVTFYVMSPEEAWEDFDRAAQLYLHMSGDAFIRAWDAGEFDNEPERPELVRLVMLRPFGR